MTAGSPLEQFLLSHVALFLLTLARVSGIFLAAPFYSGTGIPVRLKASLAILLSFCLAPMAAGEPADGPQGLDGLVGMGFAAVSELGIGFALGFSGAVVLAAAQTAGHLIAQDIGITIANVIDPISNVQTSVIGQLKMAVALYIFLALDFHHAVLRLLRESFRMIPLGGLSETFLGPSTAARWGEMALSEGTGLFDAAVRLGLPVGVTLLLVTVAMALLARAVPEMNVFIIGFGIRLLVGLWVLVLSVPVMARVFQVLFEKAALESARALRALAEV